MTAPAAGSGAVAAIVVAAGRGERFGASVPKALTLLDGRPLLVHAAAALRDAGVDELVVVAPADRVGEVAAAIAAAGIDARVSSGGATRRESVAAGLAAVDPATAYVLVHDAARALAPAELAVAVLDALRAGAPAVIPGLPVVDTVKEVAGATVTATLDRAGLVAVQTPQGFAADVLRRAHAGPAGEASDDAALVERLGVAVHVVTGSARAMKITHPIDLAVAELLLADVTTSAAR